MRHLRVTLIAALCAVASTQIASATDLPLKARAAPLRPATVVSWTGLYVGGDVGGGWASQDVDIVPCSFCGDSPQVSKLKGSGVLGGIYAGYNFVITPEFLMGIEGDFTWTDLDDANAIRRIVLPPLNPDRGTSIRFARNVEWLASIRGRLGWTFAPNALLYATGGGAWGRVGYSAIYIYGSCPNCGLVPSFSNTQSGYVVGGGFEWAPWNNNWLMRSEYLYYHFSGTTASADWAMDFGDPEPAAHFKWDDLSIHSVRAGVAYKF
jgi:outer membrane immunogenic protein